MEDMQTSSMSREERAKRFLEKDLGDQRRWYSERSSTFKRRTQALALSIIAAGSATSVAQLFKEPTWVPIITAVLGAYVALAEGWQRISRYGETWLSYRIASERIKREQRLFQNGAGSYRGLEDNEAFLHFVESIEGIIAEEQQIYWQQRQSSDQTPSPQLSESNSS